MDPVNKCMDLIKGKLYLDMTLIKVQCLLWLFEVDIGWDFSILQNKNSF